MRLGTSRLAKSLALPWLALFLFSCLLVTQLSNTNARSRIAGLRALTEGHVLNIDNYKEWTFDWSLAPNGHYYSNKAPGGVLLGLPVFAATDLVASALYRGPLDDKGRRPEPGYLQNLLLVLLLQILPFAWLVAYGVEWLRAKRVSPAARNFFALAALFGNTAAIYMNSYFGHGLAAWLYLAFALAWLERRYAIASCCCAFAMLTDYVGAVVLPVFLLVTLLRERSLKPAWPVALGGAPAGALGVWYHWVAFGSPLKIATQFNNPTLMDHAADQSVRLFSVLPDPTVAGELLFGQSRGLLFTQGWVLLLLGLTPVYLLRARDFTHFAALIALSFCALLWLNSGYGEWTGGWCAGPRYLALAFPALALLGALAYDSLPGARALLWLGLAVALLFRALIFPHSVLAPPTALWPYYISEYARHPATAFLRLGLLAAAAAGAAFWAWRLAKRERAEAAAS